MVGDTSCWRLLKKIGKAVCGDERNLVATAEAVMEFGGVWKIIT